MIIETTEERKIHIEADELLRVSEAAKMLKRHRATVYRWISRGLISTSTIGKMVFVPRAEIERLTG